MLSAFSNTFKIPELRTKILITLALVFASRFVANIPTPGVSVSILEDFFASVAKGAAEGGGSLAGLLDLADLFSGGALRRCSVGAMTIWPYISASIILQLLTAVVPSLERLAREGDVGRQKITQYARYLTLIICALQSLGLAKYIEDPRSWGGQAVVSEGLRGPAFWLLTMLAMTTGTMFIMWMGEQITQRGIGNGISIIITVNICSRLPVAGSALYTKLAGAESAAAYSVFTLAALVGMLFVVTMAVIAVTQSQRKIPITTTKRVVGRKVYGGQNTFMPLRMSYANVMPLIFASSLLMFPPFVLKLLKAEWSDRLADMLIRDTALYLVLYGVLIMFFSYFWVATQFNPIQIADDLKKHGGYIPGIRPGRPTAEFLDKTMGRLTLAGAVFLTAIAVLPSIAARMFRIDPIIADFFGGTAILIIVGVLLDTMRQVESHLLMRHYDGFLTKGRLRGRK